MGDIGRLGQTLYTEGEVRFLLSLTRDEAISLDASQPDSCAHLTEDVVPSGDAGETDDLFIIVRWHDVQAARRRVVTARADLAVLQATAWGLSQREVAGALHVSQATVNRRLRASMRELLTELGVTDEADIQDVAEARVERALRRATRPKREAA